MYKTLNDIKLQSDIYSIVVCKFPSLPSCDLKEEMTCRRKLSGHIKCSNKIPNLLLYFHETFDISGLDYITK